ncbi:MAG: WD40/YVTN/BNR-like repeat-containing protein [Chloroflexota bacterium]
MGTTLYCGTGDGVATVTRQGSGGWTVEARGLSPYAVREVAVSPTASNILAAGTRGDGVWLSEDCGKSWTKPSYGRLGPGKVTSVVFDPHDPRTLWAGGEPIELFVSHNLGKSWDRVESVRETAGVTEVIYPVATVEPHVRCIAIDPTDANIMYLALQVGYILKTTNGGTSWRMLSNGLDEDVHVIVIDPSNPRTLLISTGGEGMRSGKASGKSLYRSEDGGESWQPIAMEFHQEYSATLAMHPHDPQTLVTCLANGNPGQWKRPSGPEAEIIGTHDGGRTWQALQSGVAAAEKPFAATMAYDSELPDHVYAGFRRGELAMSEDAGSHWTDLGIQLSAVNDVKVVHI